MNLSYNNTSIDQTPQCPVVSEHSKTGVRMCSTFLTEGFHGSSLVSVLAVFVVVLIFVLRPPAVNKEQTQVSIYNIGGRKGNSPRPKSGLVH